MHSAVNAYMKALRILPEFQEAFINLGSERLSRLLWTQPNYLRLGFAIENGDTTYFAAFPELRHDTLAFVPRLFADIRMGGPTARPATQNEAIARNILLLRTVASDWVHAVPGSSAAHLQFARALEASGAIGPRATGDTNAIDEARRARALAARPPQRLNAMLDEARLDIEIERFAAARAVADSILGAWTLPTAEEAGFVATAAALTGHVHRTVAALRMTAAYDTISLPPPRARVLAPIVPASDALAFLGYAACGAPVDSMRATAERTTRSIRAWVDTAHRQEVRRALMDWPATLAYDEMGASLDHRSDDGANSQMAREWALAHGDVATERTYLAQMKEQMRQAMPGDADPGGLFVDARLAVAAGDTASAISEIDFHGLDAIPRFGLRITEDASEAAPFVRMMALRADLAHHTGDARTASRWAQAVIALWGGADPELQPVVTRARALAQP
jgi:hypothetical protein